MVMKPRGPDDWSDLKERLEGEAVTLMGLPPLGDGETVQALAAETRSPRLAGRPWWQVASEQSAEECATIDGAARAFAGGRPLPRLSPAERARLALRMLLASRIARALLGRQKGWFPTALAGLSRKDLLEFLLVKAWPFWLEVFDESCFWFDRLCGELGPPVQETPPTFSGGKLDHWAMN